MKILVTGGSGMVGQNIKYIEDKYREHKFVYLSSKDCDLTNRYETMCYFQNGKFDFIIHLAANVGGLYKNMSQGIKMFSDNIKINENVLEACYTYNIERGIFVLSSCIYPENPSKFPMDETMIHESPPHHSNQGYAYAKRMLEMQCRQYNKKYNTEYICLIPVNLYGKYDNFKIGESHVIPELIHRLYLGKKNDIDKYDIYGTGEPLRQFMYAENFAEIILKVLFDTNYKDTEPMIICNDETKIKNLVDILCDIIGINKEKIEYNKNKSNGIMKKTVSNEKLLKMYPNIIFKDLNIGLNETYNWFIKNYTQLRK